MIGSDPRLRVTLDGLSEMQPVKVGPPLQQDSVPVRISKGIELGDGLASLAVDRQLLLSLPDGEK
jgi:hypothetical protein